jgi:hypothetical protein
VRRGRGSGVGCRGWALELLLALSFLSALSRPASAQHAVTEWARHALTPSLTGAIVEHRVSIADAAEQATGVVAGIAIAGRVRPWLDVRLGASGGRLQADWPPSEDRTVGQFDVTADASLLPWLGVVTTAVLRGYEGDLARQRWSMLSVGPEGRVALYGSAVHGTARVAIAPFVSVSNAQAPERALLGAVALSYERTRLEVGLEYSIERYDFPAAGGFRRLEQLSGLGVRVGWKGR